MGFRDRPVTAKELTEYGRVLYEYANDIYAAIVDRRDSTEEEIRCNKYINDEIDRFNEEHFGV
jgi:hypothetical protein